MHLEEFRTVFRLCISLLIKHFVHLKDTISRHVTWTSIYFINWHKWRAHVVAEHCFGQRQSVCSSDYLSAEAAIGRCRGGQITHTHSARTMRKQKNACFLFTWLRRCGDGCKFTLHPYAAVIALNTERSGDSHHRHTCCPLTQGWQQ